MEEFKSHEMISIGVSMLKRLNHTSMMMVTNSFVIASIIVRQCQLESSFGPDSVQHNTHEMLISIPHLRALLFNC